MFVMETEIYRLILKLEQVKSILIFLTLLFQLPVLYVTEYLQTFSFFFICHVYGTTISHTHTTVLEEDT